MLGQSEDGAVNYQGISVVEGVHHTREDPVVGQIDPGPQVEGLATNVHILIAHCVNPVVDREQRLANATAKREYSVSSNLGVKVGPNQRLEVFALGEAGAQECLFRRLRYRGFISVHEPIPPPPPPRRRLVTFLITVGVVLLTVAVLQHVNTNDYSLTPGKATRIAPLVKIHGLTTNPRSDKIMLADVYLSPLSAWQWLTAHLQSHVEFVNANELVEPGIPTDELFAQGFLEMSDSKQAAEVAALRALGWKLKAVPSGAVVTGVVVSSPARKAGLRVADEIVGVNGTTIRSSCGLFVAIHSIAAGAVVRLNVAKAHINAKGVITLGTPRIVALTTAAAPRRQGTSGCAGVSGPNQSYLGIQPEDGFRFALPGRISIDTSYIGGPSAGLAMTLSLINKLSAGTLTGHWVVAATGTIDANGNVGDVGGVAEKTVAVERAGAQIFFVPKVELPVALAVASSRLRVIGVVTLGQALRDLHALGGDTPVALTTPR